jgi:hypothetical protein
MREIDVRDLTVIGACPPQMRYPATASRGDPGAGLGRPNRAYGVPVLAAFGKTARLGQLTYSSSKVSSSSASAVSVSSTSIAL